VTPFLTLLFHSVIAAAPDAAELAALLRQQAALYFTGPPSIVQ
jgi:hypothetical protein